AQGKCASELRRRIAHLFGEPLQEPFRLTRGAMLTIATATVLLVSALLLTNSNAGPSLQNSATSQHEHHDISDVELQAIPQKHKPNQVAEPPIINPEQQERATLSGQIVMEDGSPAKVK